MNTPIQLSLPLLTLPPADAPATRHLNFPLNVSITDAQIVEIQRTMKRHYRRGGARSSSFSRYHSLRSA